MVAGGGVDDLDLSDAGEDLDPARWHAELGGDFEASGGAAKRTVLDVRNHYESAVRARATE